MSKKKNSSRLKIRLGSPHVGARELKAIIGVLRSGQLTMGGELEAFEEEWALQQGVAHAVAVSSGTSALEIALRVAGVKEGDEVIVPGFSWVASANAVVAIGARPIFADIAKTGYLLDLDMAVSLISKKTRAIMSVHQFGEICDTTPISAELASRGVVVVEDAACAVGTTGKGGSAGNFGVTSAFSLHPRKSITTGEGGMVCTQDVFRSNIAKSFRNHGLESSLVNSISSGAAALERFSAVGMNYRMSEFSAAVGRVQLTRLEHILRKRSEIADFYNQNLKRFSWMSLPPRRTSETQSNWQAYVVELTGVSTNLRSELIAFMKQLGIEVGIGSIAIPLTPAYRGGNWQLNNTERAYRQSVALPIHSKLSTADLKRIVGALENFERALVKF